MRDTNEPDAVGAPDLLDRAAALGFGSPGPGAIATGEAASVLAQLPHAGGPITPVLLRDDPDACAAVVTPRCETKGRYRIDGELARGGMGAVLRGHDVDLGRDVAMKVLLPEHADNPDVVRRFVEEAQIAGQLQHPGIPPVYEIGVGPDQRPYFTMKLVRGRTLTALLADRASLERDRRRFIDLFASVCHTVAYAHARGVVHRDLKPSNVMVGAFGEVLVLDWGLGKILPRGGREDDARPTGPATPEPSTITSVRSTRPGSQSVAGCVVGTPRYMPPEQARGDAPTPRADVYALGGLLTEILTGVPPHAEPDGAALYAAIARGDVAEALGRLDRCGADADVVAIARDCLAADPAGRPRDAGEVSQRVVRYLGSVDDRARGAQLDAAEARGRAVNERRRRRLAVALVASLAAAVLVGAGLAYAADVRRRERAQEIARSVDRIADEAAGLRTRAAAAVPGDAAGRWREALAVARQAEAVTAVPDADDATRTRAAGLVHAVAAEAAKAAELEALTRREEALLRRIDMAIARPLIVDRALGNERSGLGFGMSTRLRTTAAEIRAALTEYFGRDLLEAPPTDAVVRIRSTRIAAGITDALFDWWTTGHDRERLDPLLALLDPDPWMAKLRGAVDDPATLVAMLTERPVEQMPTPALRFAAFRPAASQHRWSDLVMEAWLRAPSSRAVLATALVGDSPSWVRATPPAANLALHPDAPEAWAMYGQALQFTDARAAVHVLRRASKRFPSDVDVATFLAMALSNAGDSAAAREAVDRAAALGQDRCAVEALRSKILLDAGDARAALASAREVIHLDPDAWQARYNAGCALHVLGECDAAVALLREVTEVEPAYAAAWSRLGVALADAGHAKEGVAASGRGVELSGGQSADGLRCLGYCQSLSFDFRGAIDSFERALQLEPGLTDVLKHLCFAFDYIGEDERYLAAAEKLCASAPDDPQGHLWVGIARCNRGDFDAGLDALRRAVALSSRLPALHVGTPDDIAETSVEVLRSAESGALTRPRLVEVAAGHRAPESAREAGAVARHARTRGNDATAARFLAHAVALVPDDDPGRWGYVLALASSASRAGAGLGDDVLLIDNVERARWRAVALEKWQAFVATHRTSRPRDKAALEQLAKWGCRHVRGAGLEFLREPEALERFPADERAAIRDTLADLDAAFEDVFLEVERARRKPAK